MKRETIRKKISSLTAKFAALLVAFACAGSAWGAETVEVTSVEALKAAVADAQSGDTVKITAPGTYAPGQMTIPQNITIQGVDGVKLDYSTFRTQAGIGFGDVPNGATFKDVEIYVGGENDDNIGGHGGWQWDTYSSGVLTFDGCKFSGLFGNGKINQCFTNCTFTQTVNNYFMWIYNNAPVSYINCVFNYQKKCLHVYNEGNAGEMEFQVYVKDCTFNPASGSETEAKGPINVKNDLSQHNGNIKSVTVIVDGNTTTTTANSEYVGNFIQLQKSTDSASNTSLAIGNDIVLDSDGKIVSGTFTTLVVGSTAEPLIASGSAIADNGDGTYAVAVDPNVAYIGATGYRSLQDAVNKVTNGQTIRLVADCDEPVLVARDVSFSIVPDSGIAFTGSIEKGSDDTAITATDGENGAKSYMVVLQDLKYPWTTEGQAQLQACIKKAWEKPQEGLYIAGRKIRKSGRYDGEGYPDAEGPITVDLENHTIALNSATITVNSSPVQTYVKTSTASASNGRSENVVDNSVPYEGVVCLNEVSYAHPGSGRNDNTTRDYYWWLLGYNMASDNMATAGIAILDDNAWTLTLVGENKIQVNAAFSYPSGSYTTAGCAYGIYAKGNLTVVKGNGESVGNLVADITNNGTGNYQSANYYPGNSAVCSMGNLTISEGTAISAILDGTMTATVSGTEYTTQNFAKYGAIYAATNVTISGATVAATNKLVSSAAGYGNGVSAIGSRYGNITIDGSVVDAVCLGQYQALVSGEMVTAYRGQGISTYGAYGAYTTVEIKGGADVNIEAGFSGIDGNGGVTISGQGTVVDVDVVGDGNGIAASQGTYQISEASVTVNAAVAVAQSYKTGSSISTGDYSSSVPANAVAANTYQYYQNGMYHLTDTIPTGWVAYYDGTFYMDPGSSAEAIALCGEGKSVYINEDSSAAKTGIGEGRNFTVYVLEGKSYTGAVTSERLVSNLTTGDATEFDGKTYVPNTFTMSVDPEHAVAKIVKADGATTYYASMTTSYSSPSYTGAASSLKAGDTLVILEDLALTSSLSKSVDWTLDLNGCKVTCGNNYYVSQSTANYTLTIKDSSATQTGVIHQTYVPSNNSSAGSGVRCSNGTIVIESGRFTGGNTPVVATGSGVIEIRGGYFDGALYVATYSPGTYVCYGGTYTVDPVKHVADGYAAAKTLVNETDLWIVGRLDMTTSVNATSDISAEYVISASIYDADYGLIAKLAEDQTIAVNIDTTKDVAGSTLAKFDAEKVVTTALLNAEDSSKITAIAISVQSAMTNKVESINNSTKERLGTAVYYDVKPVAEVAAAGADSTAFTIANDAIADGAEFAFDLALPEIEDVEAGTVLTVTHISAGYNNETTYDIAKADSNDGLYVSAATTHFSTFRVNYSTQSATAKLLTVSGNADFISTSYLETDIATAVSKVGQKGTVGKVVLLADFTLNAPVSVTKPIAGETIVDLNGHAITLAEGVENAFVLSGEGTTLTVKNGTAPVGISGYPENYAVVATTADGATTYTAGPAVAQVEIAGTTTKYADLHDALEAGKAAGSVVTLLADVDLDDEDWTPVGTSDAPFYGSFDGNGHTISNLWVASENGDAGLFGWVGKINSLGGTFKDLTLVNVSNYCKQDSAANVGTLAGFANATMISNITVKGAVVVGRTEVAGLTGNAYTSKILDCHLEDVTVTCGYGRTGGIAGQGYCTISGCSVTGLDLTGAWAAGGIIGLCNACTITDNYVQGALRADVNYGDTYKIGGIVGTYNETAKQTISGNYCNATVFNYQHSTIDDFPIVGMLYTSTPPSESIEALAENSWSREIFDTDNVGMANYDDGIPRNNNLIAIASDLQYVEEGDLSFVSASGITPESAVETINAAGEYRAVLNQDGTVTVVPYAAQIGTTKYETLADAVEAVPADGTETAIQMIADEELSATVTIPVEKNVVLDLNGKTVAGEVSGAPVICNNGTLTITDSGNAGTIANTLDDSTTSVKLSGAVNNYGTLTLNGGCYSTSVGGSYVIYTGEGATTTVNDCTVTGGAMKGVFQTAGGTLVVNDADVDVSCKYYVFDLRAGATVTVAGGTFNCAKAIYQQMINLALKEGGENTLNIAGGTFTFSSTALQGGNQPEPIVFNGTVAEGATAAVNISGGAFSYGSPYFAWLNGGPTLTDSSVSISGGIFNVSPVWNTQSASLIADGYSQADNTDAATMVAYPYTVVSLFEAQIVRGGAVVTPKGTLAEMIAAATSGDTIQLLKDVEIASKVQLNKEGSYTIDGNGFAIKMAEGATFDGSGILIFGPAGVGADYDLAANIAAKKYTLKNATITGFNAEIIRCEGCSLTLEDCAFTDNNITADLGRGKHMLRLSQSAVTMTGCTASGNTASQVVYYEGDSESLAPLVVTDCLFSGNTLNSSSVILIADSASAGTKVQDSTFADNTIGSPGNVAVVYCSGPAEVSGNLFSGNSVATSAADKREGVIVLGSDANGTAVASNAFVGNTLGTTATDYATVWVNDKYDDYTFDVSGNYWGDGEAPDFGSGKDVYQSAEKATVAMTGHATEYATSSGVNGATVTVQKYFYQDTEDANLWHVVNLIGLKQFRDSVNGGTSYAGKTVQLDNPIDLAGENWTPIGTESNRFTGTFDGQNNEISNLTIDDASLNYAGLFGRAIKATFKNVKIKDVNITAHNFVGSLIGETRTGPIVIEDCTVSGAINLSANHYVGGLAGQLYGLTLVSGCSVDGTAASTSFIRAASHVASDGDGDDAGGLIGFAEPANISGCAVSNVTVEGYRQSGGLVGLASYGTVSNDSVEDVVVRCIADEYTAQNNTKKMAFGGLIGVIRSATAKTLIEDCAISGVSLESTATGLSVARMGYITGGIYATDAFEVASSVPLTVEDVTVENCTRVAGTLLPVPSSTMPVDGYVSVAKIGNTGYTTLAAALKAAADGDVIEILAAEISEGSVKFPATLKNVTIKPADGVTATLKNTNLVSADGSAVDYEGITIDGLVFDNSRIHFTGSRSGEVVYKDWAIVNCTFNDITAPSGNAAVNFGTLKAGETMNGFTFTNNVIDGVSGSANNNSGLLVNRLSGDVLIEGNLITNVAWNALHLMNGVEGATLMITNNLLSSKATEGVINLYGNKAQIAIAENAIIGDGEGVANIAYPSTTIDASSNYWGGGEPTLSGAQTGGNLLWHSYYTTYTDTADWFILSNPIVFVAQIGTTKYTTLAAAIAAVPTDGTETTITMIADEAVVAGVTIAAGQNVVLELNGKTISGNTDSTKQYALITNKGTLTIQDNTDTNGDGTGTGLITTYISNPDTGDVPGYASNTISNYGKLTVKSGKIVNNGSGYACYAIDNLTNGNQYEPELDIQGGRMVQMNAYTYAVRLFCNSTTKENKATISGGVIEGGYGLWVQTPNANANKATLTISGGTLNANDGAALYVGGTKADNSNISIVITDGEINGTGAIIQGPLSGTYKKVEISGGDIVNVQCGANVEDFISGGTFDNPVNEAYCADGYIPTDNGNGIYGVKQGNYVAQLMGDGYVAISANIDEPSEDVYLDMWSFWGMEGMVDANNNECPQYVSITDETLYRDTAVADANGDEAWVSAKYLYENYLASGKKYYASQTSLLYEEGEVIVAKFESLTEAVAAVPTDGTETTITMINSSAEPAVITVATGKNVVLDLNGKTVSYTTDEKNVYFLTNKGTLTVKDTSENAEGQILLTAQPDSSYSIEAVTVYNLGGTLTLESGTVKNATGGGLAYAIKNAVNWGHVSTFNMTGGIVSAPGGDAALRVYNNTAFSVTADCKNYVNISGGTILDTGIFIDTFLAGPYSASFTGDNLANEVNISGGTINGLIDMKIRHPFNTALNITGGDFTNTKLWVRKHSEYNASLAEPTDPMVYISGGKFAFVAGKAFGLAYDCGATSWTSYEKPYAVSGGVFNLEVPTFACAEGYIPADNTDDETKTVYPHTVAFAGDIIYPIEGTAGVPIALAWATNNTSVVSEGAPVTAADVPNIITALRENGANNMPKWESYVLGLNPADPTAVLRLTATAKNATTVTVTGSIDTTKFPSISNVTVTFRLAAQNGAEWTDIATGAASPSFDVALDDVAGKVLTIFADIVTE